MNIGKVINYMMNIGIATSIYSMYKIYDGKKGLPEGVCLINDNSTILYISITILVISLILSVIYDIKNKNKLKNI